jgi:hypothetical protein
MTQVERDSQSVDLFLLGMSIDHVVNKGVHDAGVLDWLLKGLCKGQIHQNEKEIFREDLVLRFRELT